LFDLQLKLDDKYHLLRFQNKRKSIENNLCSNLRLKANDNQMPGLALRAAAIRSSLTQARKDTDGIRPGFHFVDHRLAEPGIGEGPGAEGQEEGRRTPGDRAH